MMLFNDEDKSLQSKAGGKFGLNQKARVSVLEFNETAGKDNGPGNAVDLTVIVGDKEFRRRIYEPTRIFDKDGNVRTDVETDSYKAAMENEMKHATATITHIVKSTGVTQDAISKAFASAPPTSFTEGVKRLLALVPTNFVELAVDVFLQYQYNISEGQTRTWLELPKNMKSGKWLVPAQTGTFGEAVSEDGELNYVNESGINHPFSRSSNYMGGNLANQQNEAQTASATDMAAAPSSSEDWD